MVFSQGERHEPRGPHKPQQEKEGETKRSVFSLRTTLPSPKQQSQKSVDRANLNTPNRSSRAFGGFIHTDIDTTLQPLPVNVQGVLSLVDVDGETGGFQCVPELFRTFEEWKLRQPTGRDGFKPDVTGFEIYPVPMKAGDLLIFNSLLAHGIRPNTSENKVRMAQYIAVTPCDQQNTELRGRRISSWHERRAPEGYAFPGDPREWERTRYGIAELTPFGRRLLGLDLWP